VAKLMDTATAALVGGGAIGPDPDVGRAMGIAKDGIYGAVMSVLPLAVIVLILGVFSAAMQGGIWVAPKLLRPKLSRLNPLQGAKRMFGSHGAWAMTKALLKSSALVLVVWVALKPMVPTLMGAGSLPLQTILSQAVEASLRLLRWCAVAGLLMAFGDYAVVRRRNNKSLKMTKHEVKEEMKNSDGSPEQRGAIRSRALAISRSRMMADVPQADVVVVNPTHVAVALRYEAGRGAPRVVAKGGDHLATRIRDLARQHRVPMVEDIPLARTLYASVEVGREIPADLFEGVARVLAFIMTLKARGSVTGTHKVSPLLRR
jgi:flagellar biosynthetic protein FlhB